MQGESKPWNPWSSLKGRRDIVVLFADTGDMRAVHQVRGRAHVIVIAAEADQVERNHLLAHELVHIERGGGCPDAGWMADSWGPVIAREEDRVEGIVAARLIPTGLLLQVALEACETEGRLDPWVVAERFRVPEHLAERALLALTPTAGGPRSAVSLPA